MKWAAFLGILCFAACDDTNPKGWLVDKTRLLGARTEAVGDAARSSLSVGETGNLTWLVASPTPPMPLQFAWAACAPPSGDYPSPRCEGPVLASGSGSGTTYLTTAVTMPAVPGGELFVLGAFCTNGTPVLDPVTFNATCASGTALLGATSLFVSAAANHNPPIADADITMNGAVLPPSSTGPVDAPCTGSAEAPVVVSGVQRTFGFHFHEEQREAGESLVLSHVVSGGELDRQYSAFDVGEAAPKDVTIDWKPPVATDVTDAGRIVEAFFVLRDGRGGTTFARRTVCARPR